jgi:hypothetical protein
MTVSTLPLFEAPVADRARRRALAAIIFLLAIGSLMLRSLLASGDDWSVAGARSHVPAPRIAGPIDPRC